MADIVLWKEKTSRKNLISEKLNYSYMVLALFIIFVFEFVIIVQESIPQSLVIACEIIIVYMIGTSYLLKKEGTAYLALYIILVIYQNLIISLISVISGKLFSDNYKLIPPISFIYATLLFVISWLAQAKNELKNIKSLVVILILNLLWIIISFFRGEGSFLSRAAYLRNFTLYMLLLIVSFYTVDLGRNNTYTIDSRKVRNLIHIIALNGFIVVVIGLIFYVFGLERWLVSNFGIVSVFQAKGFNLVDIITPGMWYTDFLGKHRKRFFSIFFEPVNLSYFLSWLVIYSLAKRDEKKIKKMGCILFYAVPHILKFGKGGLLTTFVTVFFVLIDKYFINKFLRDKNFKVKYVVNILMFGILTYSIYRISTRYYYFFSKAALPHIIAINTIITNLKPSFLHLIGNGLGSGGNFSVLLGGVESNWLETGAESAIGTMLYQVGIVGTALYVCFLLIIDWYYYKKERVIKQLGAELNYDITYFFKVGYGLIIASIFQENTLAPQCISYFMITVGILLKCVFSCDNRR